LSPSPYRNPLLCPSQSSEALALLAPLIFHALQKFIFLFLIDAVCLRVKDGTFEKLVRSSLAAVFFMVSKRFDLIGVF